MLRRFRNKLTKYSILGLILTIVCIILVFTDRPGDVWTPYLIALAIIFFTGSIFLQGYGIYETRRFSREDAFQAYTAMAQAITGLRTLAETLHNEYGHTTQGHHKYQQDKRYKRILRDFARIRQKCKDYEFDKKLRTIIEHEKAAAKYLPAAGIKQFPDSLENADRDIREYFIRRFPQKNPGIENDRTGPGIRNWRNYQ